MVRRFLLVILLVAACAGAAGAKVTDPTSRAGRWDFTVQTRYVGEQNKTGEGGSSVAVEDDLGWAFGFGYNFDDRFNIGFWMGWRSANYTATVVPEVIDPDESYVYYNWLDTGTLALSGDWNILAKRLTPYVSASIGWTYFDTNIAAGYYSGCWWDPWYGYICGTDVATYGDDAFSYSIGAGARLEVSEAVFFRIGYEYDGASLNGADGLNVLRVDGGISFR